MVVHYTPVGAKGVVVITFGFFSLVSTPGFCRYVLPLKGGLTHYKKILQYQGFPGGRKQENQ